ncbi:uncharacterized protein LOC129280723 isoform X2 [Lytechinus pictus]|uniref:uncharacterized protein LOC129280723 isoform X2 n=1 Tax=Lytechinus pictus TaxID=7653 RepID=UPI0030B9D64E
MKTMSQTCVVVEVVTFNYKAAGMVFMVRPRPHHTAAVPLRPDPVSSRQGYKDMVAERKPPFVRDPLTLSVDFMVRYVGMIASAQGLQHSQEDHLDLIQALDQAQMDGQFKFAETDQDFVTLNLSKYGIKILEKIPQDRFQIPPGIRPPQVVRWRHGLVEIIRAVHYEDSLGRQLMAVKLGQEGEELYDCLLFECTHQPQATQICKCLELLFNAVCQFTPL